jgi:hypothetical protein
MLTYVKRLIWGIKKITTLKSIIVQKIQNEGLYYGKK